MASKKTQKKNLSIAAWLLRVGLAFSFAYAAFGSFTNPNVWAGYLPVMLTNIFDAHALLQVFSVYEIALAVWLLSAKFTRYAAGLTALTLAGIIIGNPHSFDITFRDISLVFAALALAWMEE